jgi:glycosyltransferase involved in cell wall biosynthesis
MNIEKIKVSVIVSVLNAEKTIYNCLLSIFEQSHKNVEIIVIDGGSVDNTIHIIEQFVDKIHYFISEPDKGIYDAWNKAIRQVSGQWICFIGADDTVTKEGIKELLFKVNNAEINFVCAKAMLVDEIGKEVFEIGRPWNYSSLKKGLGVVHCGALHSVDLFKDNKFDDNFRIAGDFEFLLRIGQNINAIFLDKVVVKMFNGGSSRKYIKVVIFETHNAILKSSQFTYFEAKIFLYSTLIREFTKVLLLNLFGGTSLSILRKAKFLK